MLALYRAGRQRDALRVYQEARLELVEEFGLAPSEELRGARADDHRPRPGARSRRRRPTTTPHGLRRNVVVALLELVDLEDDGRRARSRRPPWRRSRVIVDRHEGEVQQLLAEELVAVFGSPVAHDDDTLRALRAVG